ncbi:methyltransferase [Nocardia goodfellowii]
MPVRTTVPVSDAVRKILATAHIHGNRLVLPTQLSPADYRQVNKVLEAMGGKWNRRERAHIFPEDPAATIAAAVANGQTPNADNKIADAYFATPASLATRLVTGEHCGITTLDADTHILEPSAGDGAFVRAILQANPDVRVTAVEPVPERAAAIGTDPRVTVVVSTFEQFASTAPRHFAAVVMNPPFALPGQPTVWIDHLHTAWSLLRDGGRLLAIAPAGYTFRSDRRHLAIRELITRHGGHTELPSGAFTSAGTQVNTVVLHARRPLNH